MSDSYRDHYRGAVASQVGVAIEQVTFKERHGYLDPVVVSLEVAGRGLFFATDVEFDDDEETYVVPHGGSVQTPADVHRAALAYARRSGRAVSEPDPKPQEPARAQAVFPVGTPLSSGFLPTALRRPEPGMVAPWSRSATG